MSTIEGGVGGAVLASGIGSACVDADMLNTTSLTISRRRNILLLLCAIVMSSNLILFIRPKNQCMKKAFLSDSFLF